MHSKLWRKVILEVEVLHSLTSLCFKKMTMSSLNFQLNHPIDLNAEGVLNRKTIQELLLAEECTQYFLIFWGFVLHEETERFMVS